MGEKKLEPRTCVDCEHMDFMLSEGPGEITFEFGLAMACRKKVWHTSAKGGDEEQTEALMLAHAANCLHYVRCED